MVNVGEAVWVTVYEADGEMDALIVKGMLESSGIQCILDENSTPYVIMGIPVHVPVMVKVMEADAMLAREIIEQPAPVIYE